MISLEQLLALLGLKKPFLIGGLIGAAISLRFIKEGTSLIGKIAFVASGWGMASYVGPVVASRLRLDGDDAYSVGFVIGLFGLSLAAAVWEAIASTDWAGVLKSILDRVIGKR